MKYVRFGLLLAGMAVGGPWDAPLMTARSSDGSSFSMPVVFQDSSGVPSVIRAKGDTLVCIFQWCRAPAGGPTWDRVAVKFSSDRGVTWSEPQLAVFNGLPSGYQRPFDPTLARVGSDSIRVYFSSSNGMPPPGADSMINTYSAVGTDGVNYGFEPNPRVDHPTARVIDPAVVCFNGAWHYASPIGAPREGAYHYVSPDGLQFSRVSDIPSDPAHNWTGNFVVNDSGDLRFYGCGSAGVWFNSSPDGGMWTGYTPTNLRGGDPSVVKLDSNDYLAVFVGQPYVGVGESLLPDWSTCGRPGPRPAFPTVVRRVLELPQATSHKLQATSWLLDAGGRKVLELSPGLNDVSRLAPGVYFVRSPGSGAGGRGEVRRIILTG